MIRFSLGDLVRVRPGIYKPDSPYGRWVGRVGLVTFVDSWLDVAFILFPEEPRPLPFGREALMEEPGSRTGGCAS